MTRKKPSKKTELAVLSKSRRHCAMCLFFNYDFSLKRGQIAHIDNDHSNSVESNLVFLCLDHHNEYHSKSPLTRAFTCEELMLAKQYLEDFVKEIPASTLVFGTFEELKKKSKTLGISPNIYQMRLPIYKYINNFLASILRDDKVLLEDIFKFSFETQETLFLFGPKIEIYCREIFKKAVEFRTIKFKMENRNEEVLKEWESLVSKDTEILLWFNDQLNSLKNTFYPYLKLNDTFQSS